MRVDGVLPAQLAASQLMPVGFSTLSAGRWSAARVVDMDRFNKVECFSTLSAGRWSAAIGDRDTATGMGAVSVP